METTESGQMNQNTELVKSLEELADAGPLIHCQSWSYIQRICMKSAVTISTQELVIVELRLHLARALDDAVRRRPNEQYAYSRCNICHEPWQDHEKYRMHTIDCWVPHARAALSKGSGQ